MDHAHEFEKPEPISLYVKVFLALAFLTVLTAVTAYIDFGMWNIVITIGIAGLKTTLILLFFMHVRHSIHLVRIFVGAGLIWLVLLLGILMSDYATRHWDDSTQGPSWITEKAGHYLAEGPSEPGHVVHTKD